MGKSASSQPSHEPAAVAAWQRRLAGLASDVKAWSEQQQWPVVEEQHTITENGAPPYSVTALHITLPEGEVRLEPVSIGGPWWAGRVFLTAWPSMHRLMLEDVDQIWRIMTESGVAYPKPWDRETFVALARELAAAP